MSCFLKINQIYGELTEVDKKIADYINNNKYLVSKLSVGEFSKKADVSTASVVRFSRKLGYKGFGELKIEIAKALSKEEKTLSYIDRNSESGIKNIISNLTQKTVESINQTVTLNEEDVIETVVNELIKGKNIYLFGVGASALVALDFQLKLLRINKSTFTSLDSHTQMMSSCNLREGDVAIAISYYGNSKEVIKSIENANERGAKSISITKYGETELSRLCNFNLYVPNVEKKLREGAISSRISMLTLIDIIYIALVQEELGQAEESFEKTRCAVECMKVR